MLTFTSLENIPNIKIGDNLSEILINSLNNQSIKLQDGDVIVLAQKIVSKTEGRLVNYSQIIPSKEAVKLARITQKDARFIELVLCESKKVIRAKNNTLIVEHKNGFICANAGIDHSNVVQVGEDSENWVLLLPEDADKSAKGIRMRLQEYYRVRVGVLIIDSHGRAWRNGTVGITIGLSGLPGVVDLRGQEDLFGFRLKITTVGAADELAAGASLLMGQAAEGTPCIHVRGFPYELQEAALAELIRPEELDLFR
ncbi:MAG: coenzyme F420-0:L-glutamate ligase [Chlorobiaceae bacterium]|nr:coenzyme F420-0:L-glutamate ligase [Chlorobiaceae bacterium]